MASCRTRNRKLKVRHETREAAETHAKKHQVHTNIKVEVYRCPDCKYWHVGRHRTTKAEKVFTLSSKEKYESILVGKLIGALKLNLNRQKQNG